MHCGIYSIAILDTISLYNIFEEQYKDTVPIAIGNTVFDVALAALALWPATKHRGERSG